VLKVKHRPLAFLNVDGFAGRRVAEVVLLQDDRAVRKYTLNGVRALIGRCREASIQLEDKTVSAKHAVIEPANETARACSYVIQDLCSTNGTRVGSIPVRRSPLNDGDTFEIGGYRFRFFADECRLLFPSLVDI